MINLVVALNRDNLIGLDGTLPWSNRPEDMKNFSRLTRGNTVVMGRKTYKSIGHPLQGRNNIIISSNYKHSIDENVNYYQSPEAYLHSHYYTYFLEPSEELFIIGGMQIYKSFAPFVERLYITVINEYNPPLNGLEAVYFPWPSFSSTKWTCAEQRPLGRDFYYVYERSTNGSKKTQEHG